MRTLFNVLASISIVAGTALLGGCGEKAGTACGTSVDKPADPSKPHFTYTASADDGPAGWGNLTGYATCKTGMGQTPIDLPATATGAGDALTMMNYDKPLPLSEIDNGHTLQVNVAGTKSAADPQIQYKGKTYFLLQFHFHARSEHTIAGASQPMEAHFVHQAATGELAVVGVLMKDGAANPVLQSVYTYRPAEYTENQGCTQTVVPSQLLPQGLTAYHYQGSLTTPPCTEGLEWFVMTNQVTVSAQQAADFTSVVHGGNARPVQPLNGRTIDKVN